MVPELPVGRRIYAVNLSYNIHVPKSGLEVTPKCPLWSDHLYENAIESQLWLLYDSNKKLVAVGDAFPQSYSTKLDKGDYVLKMQVCSSEDERSITEFL